MDTRAPQCGHKGPAGVNIRCCQEPVRAGYIKANMSLENITVETPQVLELFKTHHKGSLFAEGGCVVVSHYTML